MKDKPWPGDIDNCGLAYDKYWSEDGKRYANELWGKAMSDYDWAEAYEKAGHDAGAWYSLSAVDQVYFKSTHEKPGTSTPTYPYVPEVAHYTCHPSGVEPKDISGHHTYNVGTCITYCMRSPYKHESPLEDLIKARDHLNFEIERLQA